MPAPRGRGWPPDPYPAAPSLREARELARSSGARVAFAVLDADGGVRGYELDAEFSSASATKALLLAAELRRLHSEGRRLDEETRSLLEPMITYSDNAAAGAVYARVGDEGLERVATRAGMRSFSVDPGFWGGAQLTAADLARFYHRLDRVVPRSGRAYAKRLLAGVTASQRWGIPAGAGRAWTVYFKGGWRPAETEDTTGPVTHQGALLVHRSGQRLGLAVLTDLPPGETSYALLQGITRRLLARPPAPARWPAN